VRRTRNVSDGASSPWRARALVGSVLLGCAAACNSSAASSSGDSGAEDAGLEDGRLPPIVELNAEASGSSSAQCGALTCDSPALGMSIGVTACCLVDGGCGASLGAAGGAASCLDTAPGTADPSCPSAAPKGFTLVGCCSVTGFCGVDLSVVGIGCVPVSAVAAMATADAGPPRPCGDGAASGTHGAIDASSDRGDGARE
jgi:hypothetical protein